MKTYERFIKDYTELQYLDLLPEIRLFLSNDNNLHSFLQQEDNKNTPYPFWAYAWAGGIGLARFILDNPHIVNGKCVEDYCSGSGIIGIAAKMAGAKEVVCVDIDPIANQACLLNARANNVDIKISSKGEDIDVLLSGDPWGRELDGSFNYEVNAYLSKCENVYIGYGVRKNNSFEGFDRLKTYNISVLPFLENGPSDMEVEILYK